MNHSTVLPAAEKVASFSEVDNCFHCGLPLPSNKEFKLLIDNKPRYFCCTGCQAVASLIHQGGLGRFYEYRSELNKRPESKGTDYSLYDRQSIQQNFVVSAGGQQKTAHLLLDGISCAACVWLIETFIQSLTAVVSVSVNTTNHQCIITWESDKQSLSFLMAQLDRLGYRPTPFTEQEHYQQQQQQQRRLLLRLGLAGFGMMQVGMVAVALYAGALQGMEPQWVQLLRWVSLWVATPVVLFSAQPFWYAAWRNINNIAMTKKGHLIMDVPVSLAILLAYFASVWATLSQSGEVYFDSISMFTFFLLLGRYFEMRFRHRNQQAMGLATDVLPLAVTRIRARSLNTAAHLTDTIPLIELNTGDHIIVYSGDTIPCDGIVIDGASAVVESILTGEEAPIKKGQGDQVIAGTINTDGSLVIQVSALGDQTRLSTIHRLVQQAEQEKPAIQQLADRVASYFVGAVLLISLSVYTTWYFIAPESALWVTLSVLVVTCPCALALATPTVLTAAVSTMRSNGLLVIKGHVIEALTKVDKVIFDKTGTLTHGSPIVEQVVRVDCTEEQSTILSLAAALETGSSHPIAKAFSHYSPYQKVKHHKIVTNAGVSGMIAGDSYRLGKPSFALETQGISIDPPHSGQWLLMTKNRNPMAWIGLSDSVRASAKSIVRYLHQASIPATILSGDGESSLKNVAEQLQIDYRANQTPEQKLAYIRAQQAQHQLLMVGDGINDVPVLAGANVSVAMNSATDFTCAHADSVLLNDDLTIITRAMTIAQQAKKIIQQNMAWAITYNITALPLAAFGFIPPYVAAIGMSLSSFIVVVNALRLYRLGPKKISGER